LITWKQNIYVTSFNRRNIVWNLTLIIYALEHVNIVPKASFVAARSLPYYILKNSPHFSSSGDFSFSYFSSRNGTIYKEESITVFHCSTQLQRQITHDGTWNVKCIYLHICVRSLYTEETGCESGEIECKCVE
jgi:hypothetical protein